MTEFFAFNPAKIWHRTAFQKPVTTLTRNFFLVGAALIWVTSLPAANPFPVLGPIVAGSQASLRGGQACAPEKAPLPVKRAIWAANQLRLKPYRYGGGHKSFIDNAYDCSGTVSYALGAAGLIPSPMSSSDFRRFGESGQGKWITIYARNGHTFAVIAGLRLDTTPYRTAHDHWQPGWQSTPRFPSGFAARHPVGF